MGDAMQLDCNELLKIGQQRIVESQNDQLVSNHGIEVDKTANVASSPWEALILDGYHM